MDCYADAVKRVGALVAARRKGWAVAINPEKIQAAGKDAALRELLNSADLKICDGVGAAVGVRWLHGRSIPRVTGIQLFFDLISAAAEQGWKVFLLGASEESSTGAFEKLKQDYPGLKLVGRRNGYFEDAAAVVKDINAAAPDLLFVAMGSPRQEYWIGKHQAALDVPFCMGVGGTLDVVSGNAKWAPAICRKTGTEWFYRLVTDPRRWRRQLVLPAFALRILRAGRGG